METDFTGDYVNTENTKEGDILEITGEGEYIKKTFSDREKLVLNIPVKINGEKSKIFTPNINTGKAFSKAWGTDTHSWLGKKAQVIYVNYKSFGQTKKMIEAAPIN